MEIDLIVPESLSEIPLCRYQEFVEMQSKSNDEQFIANKMVQIFCGVKLKDVYNMQLLDMNELVIHFNKVFTEKPRLIRRFKIKDIEFGFIPNLEEITFGEYVDLESHLMDWKTYHKAMAVMFRPIKEKYKDKYSIIDYEPNEDMQDLMKFAPLDVAIAASVFFWNLGQELLIATTRYLQSETMKMEKLQTTQKEGNLVSNGVGMEVSMESLRAILQSSILSHQWDFLNVSPTLPLKSKKTKSKQENLKEA